MDGASPEDLGYMKEALKTAREALQQGEVPCAAVLVAPGQGIVARVHATDRQRRNRISHAELLLLLDSPVAGTRRDSLTLYSTLEPCVMCTAALMTEGVGRVVFGLPSPIDGGTYLLVDSKTVARCGGAAFDLTGGVMEEECARLFAQFLDLPGVPAGMVAFVRALLDSQGDSSGLCLR